MISDSPTPQHQALLVVANFVEVYLARQGHDGPVGINYLEKIQTPMLPSLFGAMLAGVDYVLMGAGIPRAIPGILDRFSQGKSAELSIHVEGADRADHFAVSFDPESFTGGRVPWLRRPKFLAIIASQSLAKILVSKSTGRVDGFIVEGPTAGGHNAPPRGAMRLDANGEPIYGERDRPDLEVMCDIGLPFWLAGSYGTPERLRAAIEAGAAGVQVGTAFAFCRESGLSPSLRHRIVALAREGQAQVRTDPRASPAGFPFKVLQLAGSISEEPVYLERHRVCDLGYLRHAYKRPDGTLGWRCPAEDIEAFVKKGGDLAEAAGRKCVCNGLLANVGLEQVRKDGTVERPLVTSGDEVRRITEFLQLPEDGEYAARDVIEYLMAGVPATI